MQPLNFKSSKPNFYNRDVNLAMKKFAGIFWWGLVISFLGTLPLGTLNVAAMQIGLQESIRNAIYFSLGCLLVEMVYVRVSLIGIDWLRKQERLMKIMEWITLGIIVALASGSFLAAASNHGNSRNVILQNDIHRFILGIIMTAINPVVVLFWFGWSTVLFSKKILTPGNTQYNIYILGIGLGTLMGNSVFIFGGKWLVGKIAGSELYLNWIIGGIFCLTALIQFIKMMRHKDAVSKFNSEAEKQK